MNKFGKIISAAALAAAIALSGCAVRPPDSGRGAESARQSEESAATTPRAPAAAPESVGGDTGAGYISPTMTVNGYDFTVGDAICCSTGSDYAIVATGEYEGIYALLIIGSLEEFKADTSFDDDDFGSSLEMAALFVAPSTGELYSGNQQLNISEASFSVGDVSDDYMNVSFSGTLETDAGDFSFAVSGGVIPVDMDRCREITGVFDEIVAGIQNGAAANAEPFQCPSCRGSGVCHYCGGDGTCHVCLGVVSHCLSCAGSNVCQYCGQSGVCKYCGGEGVMY